jgi:hypothetical protein
MKNVILSLLIFCGLCWTGCDVRRKDQKFIPPGSTEETLAVDTIPPTSVQVIDTVINFGQVNEGEVVERSFRFKNTGDHPLVVHSAKAACGCTVPEKPERPIAAGETGTIKVKFDSNGRPGQAQKTITVVSNAKPIFPTLMLQGEVIGKPDEEEKEKK